MTDLVTPKLFKDARFRAGRKLIKNGRDAIEIFATLLQDAIDKYGEASIETAPAYFEYGNALFRESQRQEEQQQQQQQDSEAVGEEEEISGKKHATVQSESNNNDDDDDDKKPPVAAKNESEALEPKDKQEVEDDADQEQEEDDDDDDDDDDDGESDDTTLALEMMEQAFAIIDNYLQSAAANMTTDASTTYLKWAQREALPRYLTNIGDVLSSLGRHADAADVYTRELECRQEKLNFYETSEGQDQKLSLQALADNRKAAEANILVAEELLSCPEGQDVVTTETNALLMKASERLSFASGYYDKARDQLQETVYLMGEIAAKIAINDKAAFDEEKENVCFASTLLMGVGERIAAVEQKQLEETQSLEPTKKKAKK